MYFKEKELPPKREIPLLNEVEKEKIEFVFHRKKKIKRWYRIYMITTVTAVVLSLAVLVSGIGNGGKNLFSAHTIHQIASKIACMDFMNLSGSLSVSEEDREESILPDILEGFLIPGNSLPGDKSDTESPSDSTDNSEKEVLTLQTLYQFDYQAVPQGETPIIPMDLSLTSYGAAYIYNSTGLTPDTEALLKSELKKGNAVEYLAFSQSPKVLIVHTHGTESYSPNGAISYLDDGGELARSADVSANVVSVGKIISDHLNLAGISTIHCTVMHDQAQYKDSYARAEETIQQYLEKYPSIQLVIDVHRDSIVKSTGELVRPVTLVNGEAAAQVMCVVGSDWGGEENPNWEGNLALALKLRAELNSQNENICRPPYLRASTYNQELAPYSLLLEVGASGNSLEEAQRSAAAIAEALVKLIPNL